MEEEKVKGFKFTCQKGIFMKENSKMMIDMGLESIFILMDKYFKENFHKDICMVKVL